MPGLLHQKLFFGCLHQHKTAQVLMITEFLHMIFWISFKPRGPCSGSILHLSITGICNVFWRGTPGFPMIDEHRSMPGFSMPGCLLALIIRRQLSRWQQRGARHVRWSPAPEPGKAFLKGDNGGWTNPFQMARFMGQPKFARNRGQTTGGQVGWLRDASTNFDEGGRMRWGKRVFWQFLPSKQLGARVRI